jgi:hypothetical protein
MKQIHFRIIELPDHQVLLTKSWDDDEGAPVLLVTFFLEGLQVTQTLSYLREEDRDKIFDTFADKDAEEIVFLLTTILTDKKES